MGRVQTEGLDELIKKIESFGDQSGEIIDAMLIAGADVMKEEMVSSVKSAGLVDTGEMLSSISRSNKPKISNDVKVIEIGPKGTDSKGVRNGQKLFTNNYGSARVPATRCVDAAEKRATPKIEKVMTEVVETEIKKRGLN